MKKKVGILFFQLDLKRLWRHGNLFFKRFLAAGAGFFLLFFYGLAQEFPLRLPFHIPVWEELNKDMLTLSVNGTPRVISALEPRSRNLAPSPDLSRFFVLSFHTDGYTSEVMAAITYFVDFIAGPGDSLTLISPTKAYSLRMLDGRDRVLDQIQEWLTRDSDQYKMARASLVEDFLKAKTEVDRLNTDEGFYMRAYSVLSTFYAQCLQFIDKFKNLFLTHYYTQSEVMAQIPDRGDGQVWWIHFFHRSFEPVPPVFKSTIKNMVPYQQALIYYRRAWINFTHTESIIPITTQFALLSLSESVLQENICYNVITWGNMGNGINNGSPLAKPEMETLLDPIVSLSGGRSIHAVDPTKGLEELRHHTDHYYEVVFPFVGPVEDVQFQLALTNKKRGTSPTYSRQWNKTKLQNMVSHLARGRVSIQNFKYHEGRLDFTVKTFMRHGTPPIGLLKIRVQLHPTNPDHPALFNSDKTLRSENESIHLSIPLPKQFTGPHIVAVTVCDLMANQLVETKQQVFL